MELSEEERVRIFEEMDKEMGSGVRYTHCYNCKRDLNNGRDEECSECGWIICPDCGACGCGYEG